MARLSVAIVGCGKMGLERARAARALGAEVTWACDPDLTRAVQLATSHRTRPVEDVADIGWTSVDAVFICTPPFARGPVEHRAIAARVPFFVEKPIGLDAELGFSVLRALRALPVVHAVGYMSRYRRAVRQARAALAGARILGASCAWVGKAYGRPWWLDPGRSGGPFNEQATHLIDLCRFLAGEIVAVTSIGMRSLERAQADDTVAVAVRFEGGACGTVLYSCLGSDKEIGVEVFSSSGRVRLEGWDLRPPHEGVSEAEDVFGLEVAAFFAAIEAGDQRRVACDLEDALRTQLVVDAIRRAGRTGRTEPVARLLLPA